MTAACIGHDLREQATASGPCNRGLILFTAHYRSVGNSARPCLYLRLALRRALQTCRTRFMEPYKRLATRTSSFRQAICFYAARQDQAPVEIVHAAYGKCSACQSASRLGLILASITNSPCAPLCTHSRNGLRSARVFTAVALAP